MSRPEIGVQQPPRGSLSVTHGRLLQLGEFLTYFNLWKTFQLVFLNLIAAEILTFKRDLETVFQKLLQEQTTNITYHKIILNKYIKTLRTQVPKKRDQKYFKIV